MDGDNAVGVSRTRAAAAIRAGRLAALVALTAVAANAAAGETVAKGRAKVTFGVEAGVQGSYGTWAFWGLGQTFAPDADYPSTHNWLETYLKPTLVADYAASDRVTLYGGGGLTGSATIGTDYFESGDTGTVLVGSGYVGLRLAPGESGLGLDVSAGKQEYRIGNRLLLSTGGGNGFERGGVTTFPHRAWGMTGIVRASWRGLTVDGFYLEPDLLESSDTGDRLLGAKAEWAKAPGQFVGASYFEFVRSTAPYPQAPVSIVENGRDGMGTLSAYWKLERTQGALAGWSFLGEVARQSNGRIGMEAWGGGVEVGYRFQRARWTPRLSYSPRYFSGDDPATPDRLERFDGLYWDGSPATWSSGSNGALAFYNSNVVVQRLRLELVLSPRDLANAYFFDVRAAETNSPIQFGQAARPSGGGSQVQIVAGVPEKPLSRDLYFEYVRVASQHVFVTAGLALSFPGDGLRAVTTEPHDWLGALVNVTIKY